MPFFNISCNSNDPLGTIIKEKKVTKYFPHIQGNLQLQCFVVYEIRAYETAAATYSVLSLISVLGTVLMTN
jgi:hypothetical protein